VLAERAAPRAALMGRLEELAAAEAELLATLWSAPRFHS
jgi:tRNA isopentenyl-2-thiomethyl-A-37 hydroxylase MiaE